MRRARPLHICAVLPDEYRARLIAEASVLLTADADNPTAISALQQQAEAGDRIAVWAATTLAAYRPDLTDPATTTAHMGEA